MHKKDYEKPWFSGVRGLLAGLVLFVGVLLLCMAGVRTAEENLRTAGLETAERAVRRAAASCYALEGAYPESYDYLKEHYGLAVDESRYQVYYTAIGENIMPDISVVELGGMQE